MSLRRYLALREIRKRQPSKYDVVPAPPPSYFFQQPQPESAPPQTSRELTHPGSGVYLGRRRPNGVPVIEHLQPEDSSVSGSVPVPVPADAPEAPTETAVAIQENSNPAIPPEPAKPIVRNRVRKPSKLRSGKSTRSNKSSRKPIPK